MVSRVAGVTSGCPPPRDGRGGGAAVAFAAPRAPFPWPERPASESGAAFYSGASCWSGWSRAIRRLAIPGSSETAMLAAAAERRPILAAHSPGGASMGVRLGIDTGGTFTDLIGLDDRGDIVVAKTPS